MHRPALIIGGIIAGQVIGLIQLFPHNWANLLTLAHLQWPTF